MTEPHPDDDQLVALALGDVDDERRDALVRHVATCEHCHVQYRALADAVDHVLLAAPRVAPPLGFSTAVLAALGMADGAATPAAPAPARRRRPRAALVALVAAAAVVVGAAGAVVVLRARPPEAAPVAAVGAALLTDDGERVGTVLESRHDGRPVLVVTLTDGRAGVTYACVLVRADGTREAAGTWELDEPAGTTWVVDRPGTGAAVTGVELVAGETVWAQAAL